jgi:predicted esterase
VTLAARAQGAAPAGKMPVLALFDAGDAPQWSWAKDLGWQFISAGAETNVDARVQALAAAVQKAVADSNADPARIYLAGRASLTPAVFYAVSRMPDAWTAAIAIGGSPQPALDSNRVFAGNFQNTPILWAGVSADDEALAKWLKSAGLNVEWRQAKELTPAAASQWLLGHRRDAFPAAIDCETASPAFARCFWAQLTRFDVNERNDVLPTTLIAPPAAATLEAGPFNYPRDDAGPGVLVSALPDKYQGPLRPGDRIVELDGRPIENAARYEEIMRAITETRDAVIMAQRGADRQRIETRVVAPKRAAVVTARVQGKYDAEEKEITLITRAVAELRVTIPPAWVPGTLNWNGLSLEEIKTPGCLALHTENEALKTDKCD